MSDCVYPCLCGWRNDPQKACGCASAVVTKYQKRISGPILDRIDIHTEVPRVDYEKWSSDRLGETSESIRARVPAARDIQTKRFSNYSSDIVCNAYHRILKLARTISDLAGSEEIQSVHLADALHASQSSEIDDGVSIRIPHVGSAVRRSALVEFTFTSYCNNASASE